MATDSDDVVWLHSQHQVSIVELAQCSGFSEEELRELVELGALRPTDPGQVQWSFSADCVVSARTAARLRRDLDLETSTLALVLSFLERIHRLEAEVRELAAQLPRPRR